MSRLPIRLAGGSMKPGLTILTSSRASGIRLPLGSSAVPRITTVPLPASTACTALMFWLLVAPPEPIRAGTRTRLLEVSR